MTVANGNLVEIPGVIRMEPLEIKGTVDPSDTTDRTRQLLGVALLAVLAYFLLR